jgi:hypothetical protein
MADQNERIILDVITDQAIAGTAKVNKAMGEMEGVITKVTQRSKSQIDRMVETWRTKAELAKVSVTGGALEMRKLELAAEAVAKRLTGDAIAAEKVAGSVRTIAAAIRETDAAAAKTAFMGKLNAWSAEAQRLGSQQAAARQAEATRQGREWAAGMNKQLALTQKQAAAEKEAATVSQQANKGRLSGIMEIAGGLGLAISAGEALKFVFKDVLLGSALYAARVEQLGVAMNAVGRASGVSQYTLRETEQRMKTIGMTTAESRMSLSRLMAGGIGLSEAPKLARLAQDVGRVAGISSSDAMERLTHAIITLQPELFRYLGLNISLEQAYKRVAKEQGIATDSLTEIQKRQIAVNEAFRVGASYAGVYADSLNTAGGQILSMDRYIKEARLGFGKEFLSELTTIVTLLNQVGKGSEPLGTGLAKWVKASALNIFSPGVGTSTFGAKAAVEWTAGKWGRPNPFVDLMTGRKLASLETEKSSEYTKDFAEKNKAAVWDTYMKRPGLKILEIKLSAAQKLLQDEISDKHPIEIDAADKLVDSLEKQIKLMKERIDLAEKMTEAQEKLHVISSDQLMDSYARSVYLGSDRAGKPIWGKNPQKTQGDAFSDYGIQDIPIRMRELNVGMPTKTGDYDRSDQARYDANIKAAERHQERTLAYQIKAVELTAGPGGERAAVEKIHQLRLASAKTQEEIAEAGFDREERLLELEKRRFDTMRSSFESMFDAAFAGATSFWSAVRRLAVTTFLTPIKQSLSGMFANMMTGNRGGGGLSGIAGSLGNLFNRGGASAVTAGAQLSPLAVIAGGAGTSGIADWINTGMSSGGYGVPSLPGAIPGASNTVAGGGFGSLAQMATGGGALAALKGGTMTAAQAGMLGLGGASLGMMGAWKAGQSGNRVLKGFAPAIGAVSGLVGFGALASMYPALIGAGPIGWIAAAGIGAAVGIISLLRKTAEQKVIDKVQQLYGIRIDKSMAQMIVETAKSTYGGNLDMAVRAPATRDLIELYSMATGQGMKGLAVKRMPTTFSQSGGRMTQQPNYWNGSVYTPPVTQTTGLGGGGQVPITIQPSYADMERLLTGRVVTIMGNNPRVVGTAVVESGRQSVGRREMKAQMLQPGLILS